MDTPDPTSPLAALTTTADLSPPSSQGPLPSPQANANGKRPLSTLDTSSEGPVTRSAASAAAGQSSAVETQEVKTHAASGYTWSKTEDEPGYGWKNKRAMEEAERAWGSILHKERKIGNRYGDPFEMAVWEESLLAGQRQ
ncbi:hypothetical protein CAC42_1952 [Sphaceloma murrayae]|uniref:Uncharacterized protein n=1 Tax=Sphaceloma murrayae TaxID=2082308 RepID=A0A2K1QMR5_9PEZI|nr:hypothetical protein CAC42_1952 [Sphaceloma murrayae]